MTPRSSEVERPDNVTIVRRGGSKLDGGIIAEVLGCIADDDPAAWILPVGRCSPGDSPPVDGDSPIGSFCSLVGAFRGSLGARRLSRLSSRHD
jgi:hypothetical protein